MPHDGLHRPERNARPGEVSAERGAEGVKVALGEFSPVAASVGADGRA